MRWIAGLVAVLAVGCAAAPAGDDGAVTSAASTPTASEPIPRSELPQAQAFQGWSDDASLVEPPRVEDVHHVAVACADKHLFPTHPASDRKRYHRAAIGHYDHFKVDGSSDVCKIKGTTKDPQTGLLRCAAATEMQYMVLSDTFEDACGHFYRGFWEVSFLTTDETMGTLISRGRTVYEKPSSEFKGDMYDGATYPVAEADLVAVAELQAGDADAIVKDRAAVTAAHTHEYDTATHLWTYVGPYR